MQTHAIYLPRHKKNKHHSHIIKSKITVAMYCYSSKKQHEQNWKVTHITVLPYRANIFKGINVIHILANTYRFLNLHRSSKEELSDFKHA